MSQHYEGEIVEASGERHQFSLLVEESDSTGEMIWPPETSRLKNIRRIDAETLLTWIVWSTMTLRCLIKVSPKDGRTTDLEILFVTEPYRYTVEDEGALLSFIKDLQLPSAAADWPDIPVRQEQR